MQKLYTYVLFLLLLLFLRRLFSKLFYNYALFYMLMCNNPVTILLTSHFNCKQYQYLFFINTTAKPQTQVNAYII